MTAQKGKDLLLKVDSDGAGSFTTVAGLRARSLALRGFPHVPGNDFMLSVASRKDKNDGKRRFS
jgi:hypothetical protein